MATEAQALGLLSAELKSDEIERRIEAMRRVALVAKAVGPETARTKLMDVVAAHTDDDDEVLFALAKSLGTMSSLVGAGHAGVLLAPLTVIAGTEETVVRDEATASMNAVIEAMSSEELATYALPAVSELAGADWFTNRVSATSLCAPLLAKITSADAKAELRSVFGRLCRDDTPMVRRAAAARLDAVANAIPHDQLMSEFLPLFKALVSDDQDSTRLLAVGQCGNLSKLLSQAEFCTHMLEIVKVCAQDKSWRVRLTIAQDFFQLSKVLGQEKATTELHPLFGLLLTDPEAAVRAAGCSSLPGYAEFIGMAKFNADIVPVIRDLSVDTAVNVRVKVSKVLVEVAKSMGRQHFGKQLMQAVMQLLRDQQSEIRLNILADLRGFTEVLGSELVLSTIVPSIISLSSDSQWRVRESVATRMPLLAEIVGTSVFDSKLLAMYFSYFHDSVAAVRQSACRALEGLGSTFGGAWCSARIMPKLSAKFGSAYLQRITVLYACESLFRSTGDMSAIHADALSIAARGAKDSVSNVRYVAAKVLHQASKVVAPALIESDIRPTLSELAGDEDSDVLFTAALALRELSSSS